MIVVAHQILIYSVTLILPLLILVRYFRTLQLLGISIVTLISAAVEKPWRASQGKYVRVSYFKTYSKLTIFSFSQAFTSLTSVEVLFSFKLVPKAISRFQRSTLRGVCDINFQHHSSSVVLSCDLVPFAN